jgi:large subunit ribosomal protein L25
MAKRRTGSKTGRKLCRREGNVPGVVYGKGTEPISICLDSKTVKRIVSGSPGQIYKLVLEDPKVEIDVMLQEFSSDPITGQIIHMDLHKISLTEKIKTEVPIVISGEAQIEKRGMLIQKQLREMTIECLPQDVPEQFVFDIGDLKDGTTLTAGDFAIPDNIRLITDPAEIVATIIVPRVSEEPQVEEEETEAGPDIQTQSEE